jgi:hypothetical protein
MEFGLSFVPCKGSHSKSDLPDYTNLSPNLQRAPATGYQVEVPTRNLAGIGIIRSGQPGVSPDA